MGRAGTPGRMRRGRLATLAASAAVVVVAVLAATGVLPTGPAASGSPAAVALAAARGGGPSPAGASAAGAQPAAVPVTVAAGSAAVRAGRTLPRVAGPASSHADTATTPPTVAHSAAGGAPVAAPTAPARAVALPAKSGSGRRVVFSISAQRVWLVGADDTVRRTYLVSGSRFGQLKPGSYQVLGHKLHTISWDDADTLDYFVWFTWGKNAAIGFHDIPVVIKTGKTIQTVAQLGTPLSDGCIRQLRPDAQALWAFAPVGTKVVVTA